MKIRNLLDDDVTNVARQQMNTNQTGNLLRGYILNFLIELFITVWRAPYCLVDTPSLQVIFVLTSRMYHWLGSRCAKVI